MLLVLIHSCMLIINTFVLKLKMLYSCIVYINISKYIIIYLYNVYTNNIIMKNYVCLSQPIIIFDYIDIKLIMLYIFTI